MNATRSGISIWVLSGFLLVCLACLEIPEMSRLTDDVSNDFTILTTSPHAPAAGMHANAVEIRLATAAHTVQLRTPAARGFVEPGVRQNRQDLLALHSFWRT